MAKTNSPISEKLTALRKLMQEHGADYYYVPSTDAHNNEYVPFYWQRRAWISHFNGSAGAVLVGNDTAYLWTDPRYFLQAEQQLDPDCYQLMKQLQGVSAPIDEWLKMNSADKVCATDPKIISIAQATQWQQALASVGGELKAVDENLIDGAWHDQPAIETHRIKILDVQYTGLSAQEKLSQVRDAIREKGATAHVVTMLDAIAWLFNIRGTDVAFNPLVLSYAIVTQDHATLFTNMENIDEEDRSYFAEQKIDVQPYENIGAALQGLTSHVLVDAKTASWWVQQQLTQAKLVLGDSPITMMKALKNATEQQGMREAHRRDALAVVKFLHWLDNNWQGQTEMSAAAQLEAFRREDPHLQGLSFPTIPGFAANGAIIHYFPTEETNKKIEDNSLLLVDSGGQYFEGTTDITRTLHLGNPTEQQKHHYTLVLKGHLALRHCLFPNGTNGEHIMAIGHLPLWQEGLDFGHGIGHGVGCYLCVHEGPQRLSSALTGVALKPGMIVSNEPGLYITGEYGIRIENLCLITEKLAVEKSLSGHGPFYQLDDLTVIPYARYLINKNELTNQETQRIDEYHRTVYQTLKDDLPKDVSAWLEQATQPL